MEVFKLQYSTGVSSQGQCYFLNYCERNMLGVLGVSIGEVVR